MWDTTTTTHTNKNYNTTEPRSTQQGGTSWTDVPNTHLQHNHFKFLFFKQFICITFIYSTPDFRDGKVNTVIVFVSNRPFVEAASDAQTTDVPTTHLLHNHFKFVFKSKYIFITLMHPHIDSGYGDVNIVIVFVSNRPCSIPFWRGYFWLISVDLFVSSNFQIQNVRFINTHSVRYWCIGISRYHPGMISSIDGLAIDSTHTTHTTLK